MLVRRFAVVVGLAFLLALPLAGCANPGSMPHLHINVTVGPRAHQAVVHISASGRCGGAYSGVVLTYPDGHRRILGTDSYGVGDIGTFELDGLPSSVYACTTYAMPYKDTDDSARDNGSGLRPFPVARMVKKNLAVSETFAVP